jgi:hypothetical protein
MNQTKNNPNFNLIQENLESGDLKRLVHDELHIDEYKSKMGTDEDVCVISFKVLGKEPSTDLVNFLEKGYEYILDADVSSGEKEGGNYLVFVELDRTPKLPDQILKIIQDLKNLTEQDLSAWRFKYRKSNNEHPLDQQHLQKFVPLTPKDYLRKYEKERAEMDALKSAAGLDVDTAAPKNEFTESLRIAAGIR